MRDEYLETNLTKSILSIPQKVYSPEVLRSLMVDLTVQCAIDAELQLVISLKEKYFDYVH